MSLESWKAQYYPVEARVVDKKDAAAHSLRKWEGLRPGAMKKHGVMIDAACADCHAVLREVGVPTSEPLPLIASSCALCCAFFGKWPGRLCDACPGTRANGFRCTYYTSTSRYSVYGQALAGDVEPLIRWLEKAVDFSKEEEKRKCATEENR